MTCYPVFEIYPIQEAKLFSGTSIVVASKNQISSDLSNEAVILNLKTGIYYGLDKVGARVWSLIQSPQKLVDVRDVIVEEYDVDPQQCENDLLALLQEMQAKGLIEVK